MSNFLRQSTASQARAIGPFLDDTDFKTAETALTIANTDVKLVANGAASANKNSGGGTHRVNGIYSLTFDATDTATVGELEVSVVVSGALPVFKSFTVLEEAVYDALFAASAPGYVVDQPVNTTKVGGTTQTARDLGASVLLSSGTGTGQLSLSAGLVTPTTAAITAIRDKVFERTTLRGTVGAASTTTSVVTSAMSPTTSVADQLKGQILMFDQDTTTAALRGQKTDITASSASGTPTLTVTALTTAPASGDTFTIG